MQMDLSPSGLSSIAFRGLIVRVVAPENACPVFYYLFPAVPLCPCQIVARDVRMGESLTRPLLSEMRHGKTTTFRIGGHSQHNRDSPR